MQKINNPSAFDPLDGCCFSDCDAESDQPVVLEWAVPAAAQVPAPRQYAALAKTGIRPAAITSTVPGKTVAPLRATNTAHRAAWCVTATLVAPPGPATAPRHPLALV